MSLWPGDPSEQNRHERTGRLAPSPEDRRFTRSSRLGTGTLACPRCDAPVALSAGPCTPADPLECFFCGHRSVVRDFLSMRQPSRPARVEVRVVARPRGAG